MYISETGCSIPEAYKTKNAGREILHFEPNVLRGTVLDIHLGKKIIWLCGSPHSRRVDFLREPLV